jgi:hypothetical protein
MRQATRALFDNMLQEPSDYILSATSRKRGLERSGAERFRGQPGLSPAKMHQNYQRFHQPNHAK